MGKLAGISYDGRPLSTNEKKRKAMEDALNWIRNNDPVIDNDPEEMLVSALSKITGAPEPKKKTPKHKKKFIEDCIGWLRQNDPGRLDTVDDATANAFTKLAGIPYNGRPLSTNEKKRKAMEDALNWIRNNDPVIDNGPEEMLVSA